MIPVYASYNQNGMVIIITTHEQNFCTFLVIPLQLSSIMFSDMFAYYRSKEELFDIELSYKHIVT